MIFEKSETLKCLVNAFAGESQARNRYTIYSKTAQKEGYEYIAEIFYLTSENEREHAKLFYKHIPAGHHIVNASYPFFLGNTLDNLLEAANGEREEWEIIYKDSAQIAKDEGYDEISKLFTNIIEIEKRHSHRFELLADTIKNNSVFKKEETTQWICRKCGHCHIGKAAPCVCPVCSHPQAYFQLFVEKF